jgi:hypothetical protein
MTLAKLHPVIQGAFDWDDRHLHEFEVNGKRYGPSENDWDDDEEWLDEEEWRLHHLLKVLDKITYLYDFGDNWIHEIEVERAEIVSQTLKKAVCLDGARARPPEDVGGVSGFQHFLGVMRNPSDEEFVRFSTLHGGPFEPNSFSLLDTNGRIQSRS